jgi:hypothetical protein
MRNKGQNIRIYAKQLGTLATTNSHGGVVELLAPLDLDTILRDPLKPNEDEEESLLIDIDAELDGR